MGGRLTNSGDKRYWSRNAALSVCFSMEKSRRNLFAMGGEISPVCMNINEEVVQR